jgi:hypothetical protein
VPKCLSNTECLTCYRNRHFFNNFTGISIHFPTILCELTHYNNTHEQQLYCVGTLSQRTERWTERRVRQETGWLAGGPLLRVSTTRRTTDTFLFISHTTNVLLFKFRCNIFIGFRIIKEMPGSVASATPCNLQRFLSLYIFRKIITSPSDSVPLVQQMSQEESSWSDWRLWNRTSNSRREICRWLRGREWKRNGTIGHGL